MGRFETAAEFYRFREPYPPSFFESTAARLNLSGATRMLDVGCGPGNLAIGFAPFVGSCTAIDIEPEMLRVAQELAFSSQIQFRQVAIENLEASAGAFDFVTIGRALHWLPQDATLAVLDRILAQDGRIAICNAVATDTPCNGWTKKFRELRRTWSGDHDEAKYRPDLDQWFAASRFARLDEVTVSQQYRFTIEELIGRGLSFSITSPAVLGERRAEFEAELRAALEPFAVDGEVEEEVAGRAIVFG